MAARQDAMAGRKLSNSDSVTASSCEPTLWLARMQRGPQARVSDHGQT